MVVVTDCWFFSCWLLVVALLVVVFVAAALVVDNDIVFRVIWIRLYGLAILEARALLDVRKLSALDQSEL